MPKDLTIAVRQDRPGVNAEIGEALGRAGVNIEGTFGSATLGEVHVLVEDAPRARQALQDAGFRVTEERDVLLRSMKAVDYPGAWGGIARILADAGVNIEFHYMATNTRIVIAVDDFQKAVVASQVLGG